jgi:hypothetical protein
MTGGSLAVILWIFQCRNWKGEDGIDALIARNTVVRHSLYRDVSGCDRPGGGYNLGHGYIELCRDRELTTEYVHPRPKAYQVHHTR